MAAALVIRDGRFLIGRRPAQKARGLLWEFAGGKVEPGENPAQALVRECREELGAELEPIRIYQEVTHDYPDLCVHLILFVCRVAQGEPRRLEHCELAWITPEEIPAYDFCPADAPILQRLMRQGLPDPRESETVTAIRADLYAMADPAYRAFHCRLIPTVAAETVIGVRTPQLRKYAASLSADAAEDFLRALPHRCYEENNLHGMLIERQRDYPRVIRELDVFLPYVDNWATCDLISPRVFAGHSAELMPEIERWLRSGEVYTVRFALNMLLKHYLREHFSPRCLELAASVDTEEYYLSMMVAWYFATALAFQFEAAWPYLAEGRLSRQTHERTVRKALESFRISPEKKERLRALPKRQED